METASILRIAVSTAFLTFNALIVDTQALYSPQLSVFPYQTQPFSNFQSSTSFSQQEPLISAFTNHFAQTLASKPKCRALYELSLLPGVEAADLFQRINLENMMIRGTSHATGIAQSQASAIESTFDNLTPLQLITAIGNSHARALLKRKLLTSYNVVQLANDLASDIERALAFMDVSTSEGKLRALWIAYDFFFARFGIFSKDVTDEVVSYFNNEISCVANGICI